MVVDRIQVHDFLLLKTECDSPVTRTPDAPHAFPVTTKGMQTEARPIDVVGPTGYFKRGQRPAESRYEIDGKRWNGSLLAK